METGSYENRFNWFNHIDSVTFCFLVSNPSFFSSLSNISTFPASPTLLHVP